MGRTAWQLAIEQFSHNSNLLLEKGGYFYCLNSGKINLHLAVNSQALKLKWLKQQPKFVTKRSAP
jgi:hypothetical protein